MLIVAFVLATGTLFADETNKMASIVTSVRSPAETDVQRLIFEDKEFRFVAVNYGHKGTQVPGFYVYAKDRSRWLRIDAISTAEAVLGRSPTMEEASQAGGGFPQVGWDFSIQYKDKPFAELPLRTSGSIVFPDKIQFDEKSKRYVLSFNSNWKIKGVETVLRFSKVDLTTAFEEKNPNRAPEDTARKLADPKR
jgi:hypothetical protein